MLKLEQDLRQFVKDWTKYADQDYQRSRNPDNGDSHNSWLNGKSAQAQECARTLQLFLDEGGR